MKPLRITKNLLLTCVALLSLPINADVKISNLEDFNFGLYTNQGRLQDDKNICANRIPRVRRGRYQIVMYGDGAGGSFEISNGVDSLPYIVFYNDRRGTRNNNRIQVGQLLTGQSRPSNRLNCNNGLSANIRIRINEQDLLQANPGRYRGTLTMTITPE